MVRIRITSSWRPAAVGFAGFAGVFLAGASKAAVFLGLTAFAAVSGAIVVAAGGFEMMPDAELGTDGGSGEVPDTTIAAQVFAHPETLFFDEVY